MAAAVEQSLFDTARKEEGIATRLPFKSTAPDQPHPPRQWRWHETTPISG